MADFLSLSLFELDLLGALQIHNSLRSLASFRDLQAPHVSKILSRIEEKVGTKLILRSPKGFILTPDGLRFSKIAANIVASAEELSVRHQAVRSKNPTIISFATIGYVAEFLLAPLVERWRSTQPNTRFRIMVMTPDELMSSGIQACDILISASRPNLTKAWDIEEIGGLDWGLFSSPFHPLEGTVTSAEVKNFPFLVPTYWRGAGYELGDDFCPIPWNQRLKGDEISGVNIAAEIVRASPQQLIYAPRLALAALMERGDVRELSVRGWRDTQRTLYLAMRSDKISLRFKAELLISLRKKLGR